MSRRLFVVRILAVLVLLSLALPPGLTFAQSGVWPPLEVQTSTTAVGNLLRQDLVLKNLSDVDLADVMVTLSLPTGVEFNRFESTSYSTPKFDGKEIAYTVLKVPAKQAVGPLSYYLDPKGAAPDTLKTKIFAEWRGQTPGSLLIPEMAIGGAPEPAAPTAQAATPAAPAATVAPATPAVAAPAPGPAAAPASFALWDEIAKLKTLNWVDLTETFGPDTPRWPGFKAAEFKTLYNYDKDGFFAQEFDHPGQYGTHMDPPAHFIKGLRFIDQIDLKEMAMPLVVINVADKVVANPDYELTVDDIKAWEAKYGPVPADSFVAMRSDWYKRWPDQAKYENKDAKGQAHYPGWSLAALKYLYETRKIGASGHETFDTDAALAQNTTGFAGETYILSTNHYQIELLCNLDKVPEAGAIAFVTVPKPKNGTGFPARVFAVVP
jgi:kynurenine formamidase